MIHHQGANPSPPGAMTKGKPQVLGANEETLDSSIIYEKKKVAKLIVNYFTETIRASLYFPQSQEYKHPTDKECEC
jgi:hypothetical protein